MSAFVIDFFVVGFNVFFSRRLDRYNTLLSSPVAALHTDTGVHACTHTNTHIHTLSLSHTHTHTHTHKHAEYGKHSIFTITIHIYSGLSRYFVLVQ